MALVNWRIEEFHGFGKRLVQLAREKSIGEPKLLAEELYSNFTFLVEPAQRKNKYGKVVKDRRHDIDAISRMIQKHFNEENAYNVQSKYLYAYSQLFECSLDYLYGVSSVKSIDCEVKDICSKLHLSEKAVTNLIEGYDQDPETFAPTRCWSEVLSSKLFSEAPAAWLHYSMKVLQYTDLEKKIDAIRKARDSASDSYIKAMLETRCISLEKMHLGKESDCGGAFLFLTKLLSQYIDIWTENWVNSQHTDFADNYYDNEIRKIEIMEAALKEGSIPIDRSTKKKE